MLVAISIVINSIAVAALYEHANTDRTRDKLTCTSPSSDIPVQCTDGLSWRFWYRCGSHIYPRAGLPAHLPVQLRRLSHDNRPRQSRVLVDDRDFLGM
jgi:hypothetical protein